MNNPVNSGSTKSRAAGTGLLEQIAAPVNLHTAYKAIRARDAGPGIDMISARVYAQKAEERLERLSTSLLDGGYKPSPVMRRWPKHDPRRPLSVPTVEDRIVQRAIALILGPILEPTFSRASWAYRKGRSVSGALKVIQRHLDAGLRFYIRTDVEKFFDTIDQGRLLQMLSRDVADQRVIRLIKKLIKARVLEGAAYHLQTEGVPQGSGLSPLLSNVYLRPLDDAVLAAGYPLIRYADDMLILCKTHAQTAEGLDFLSRQVEKLGLRLGARKTRRGHLGAGFTFLGARFGPDGRGPAARALKALTARARTLMEENDPDEAMAKLRALGRTWVEYHGPLAAQDINALPVLLGALLATPERSELLLGYAERRVALASNGPPWLHVALAEVWNRRQPKPGLLLMEVVAGAAGGLDDRLESRVRGLMAVPDQSWKSVLAVLGRPDDRLASVLGQAGCGALAREARRGLPGTRSVIKGRGSRIEVCSRDGKPEDFEPLVQPLSRIFSGCEDRHAVFNRDRRGHFRYFPVGQPLTERHWRGHLAGKSPRGLFLVRADQTILVAGIKVCVTRRDMPAGEELQTLPALVADAAATLARTAEKLGLAVLIEDTGHSLERRIWFPFGSPLLLGDARALVVRVSNDAGPPAPPVREVIEPSTNRFRRGPGPMVPLPLGWHRQTHRQGRFIDPAGKPIPNVDNYLQELEGTRIEHVHGLVRRGPLAAEGTGTRGASVEGIFAGLPRMQSISRGCGLLRALVEKARDLGHLSGEESQTLVEFLGHLPGQGPKGLNKIFDLLESAGTRSLNRRLAKLTSHPISCVRIRKRHGEITRRITCNCRFARLPRGGYPTPLLHTLSAGDIPGFPQKKRRPARRAAGLAPSGKGAQPQKKRAQGKKPEKVAVAGTTKAANYPSRPGSVESRELLQTVENCRRLRGQMEQTQELLRRTESVLGKLLDRLAGPPILPRKK